MEGLHDFLKCIWHIYFFPLFSSCFLRSGSPFWFLTSGHLPSFVLSFSEFEMLCDFVHWFYFPRLSLLPWLSACFSACVLASLLSLTVPSFLFVIFPCPSPFFSGGILKWSCPSSCLFLPFPPSPSPLSLYSPLSSPQIFMKNRIVNFLSSIHCIFCHPSSQTALTSFTRVCLCRFVFLYFYLLFGFIAVVLIDVEVTSFFYCDFIFFSSVFICFVVILVMLVIYLFIYSALLSSSSKPSLSLLLLFLDIGRLDSNNNDGCGVCLVTGNYFEPRSWGYEGEARDRERTWRKEQREEKS